MSATVKVGTSVRHVRLDLLVTRRANKAAARAGVLARV